MMEFMDLVQKRRSIRKYKGDLIPEEKLKNILEAARLAPSGANRQPWRFIVVKDETLRRRIAEASDNQVWIADAPVIIVGCWVQIFGVPAIKCIRDIAISFEHVILAATNEGLGTCWIGGFNEEKIKEILKVPNEVGVIALAPIGYPAEEPASRPRKGIEEIVSYEEYRFVS